MLLWLCCFWLLRIVWWAAVILTLHPENRWDSLAHWDTSLLIHTHTNDGSCLYQMAGSKESMLISIPLSSAVGKLQWRRGGIKSLSLVRGWNWVGNVPFLLSDVLQLDTSSMLFLLLQGFKVTWLFTIICYHMHKMDSSAFGQYIAPDVLKYTILAHSLIQVGPNCFIEIWCSVFYIKCNSPE